MDRTRVWPDFDEGFILYEDGDVIAIHKPAGVSTQAADPERPDDVVTRLSAFLRGRDGQEARLGVHQRLDRDTSGVLILTKRPAANAGLAAQLEGRSAKKRYLAGVVGWPKGRRRVTLDDLLERSEDGRMQVVRGGRGSRGKRALTQVSVKKSVGDRSLLELVLETGRMHQARVQLAHAGAPIAGDLLYGREPAPRLMLHALALEIAHPTTQKPLVIQDLHGAEPLESWLEHGDPAFAIYDDRKALERQLRLAVERRWGLGRSTHTSAFRLVNDDGDGLSGLAVDVYGDHLVAQIYVTDEWTQPRQERLLDALHVLGFDGIYLKMRPKQANELVDTRREDLAPNEAVRGTSTATPEITVLEEGVPFAVRLGDGLSTGIFLDQRRNRAVIRELAKGLRVANLFAYTCGFSIVAALGGARRTVSVDASIAALDRGRAGFTLAGIESGLGKDHLFAAEDVFAWLARMKKQDERFDLVIVDPPSYSSTKKRRFVASSDYGELITQVCAIVAPKGRVLASCNHRGLSRAKLRRMVHEGVRAAGREALQLKDLPDAPDFLAPVGRDVHMKSLLLTLR